jgi:hypothetical protein
MSALGVLMFSGMLLPGIVIIVVGVVGLRRARNVMRRGLSWLAIAVGSWLEVMQGLGVAPYEVSENTLAITAVVGIGVAGFIFWATVLADCRINERREGKERRVWTLVIVLTSVVGALLYCLVRRPKRLAELSR